MGVAPATPRIAKASTASSTVVPRSGCNMTNAANPANTTITGRTVRTGSPIWSRRPASRSAAKTIRAILASSDG